MAANGRFTILAEIVATLGLAFAPQQVAAQQPADPTTTTVTGWKKDAPSSATAGEKKTNSSWLPKDGVGRNSVTGFIANSRIDESGVRATILIEPNGEFREFRYPAPGVTTLTTGFVNYGTEKKRISPPDVNLTGFHEHTPGNHGRDFNTSQINNDANAGLVKDLTAHLQQTFTAIGPDPKPEYKSSEILTITDPGAPQDFYADTPGGLARFTATTDMHGTERIFTFNDLIKGKDGSIKNLKGHRSFSPDGTTGIHIVLTPALSPTDKKAKHTKAPTGTSTEYLAREGQGKKTSNYIESGPAGHDQETTFPPGSEMAEIYVAITNITDKAMVFAPRLEQKATAAINTAGNTTQPSNLFKLESIKPGTDGAEISLRDEDGVWTARITPTSLTMSNNRGEKFIYNSLGGTIKDMTYEKGTQTVSYDPGGKIVLNGGVTVLHHIKNGDWVKYGQVHRDKITHQWVGNNDPMVPVGNIPAQVRNPETGQDILIGERFLAGDLRAAASQALNAALTQVASSDAKKRVLNSYLVDALSTIGVKANAASGPQQTQSGQLQAETNRPNIPQTTQAVQSSASTQQAESNFKIVNTSTNGEVILTGKDNNHEDWQATISNKDGTFKLKQGQNFEIDFTVDANGKATSATLIQLGHDTPWQARGATDSVKNENAKTTITAIIGKNRRVLAHIIEDALKGAAQQGKPASPSLVNGLGEFGVEPPNNGHAILVEPNRLGGTTPVIIAQAQRKAGLTTLGLG